MKNPSNTLRQQHPTPTCYTTSMPRKPPTAVSLAVGLLLVVTAVLCGFTAIVSTLLSMDPELNHSWSRRSNSSFYWIYLAGGFGLAAPVVIAWWVDKARLENQPLRFSLSSLLIMTTFLAMLLGLCVWLAR